MHARVTICAKESSERTVTSSIGIAYVCHSVSNIVDR